MRIAVHTDFEYHRRHGESFGEHAFTVFIVGLAAHFERLYVLGRFDPSPQRARYRLGDRVSFVGLPYYRSLWRLRESIVAMLGALGRFWRLLEEVDAVWLLGPHPVQIGFGLLAILRGSRVVLGIRQDFPRYVASRHPRRPDLRLVALGLEGVWRIAARFVPVVVIGPALAEHYRHAPRVLEVTASLVSESEVIEPSPGRSFVERDAIRILSVGRLDSEKNPLLLADVLDRLAATDRRWHLTVVGEGPLAEPLAARIRERGLAEACELAGYVPYGPRLLELYRTSDIFLHVSWTEGLPQVLIEAFAAGLPVVATDVGGIREAVGPAAVLIPPGDPDAAAAAVQRLADDPDLRERIARVGNEYVRTRTIEAESARVAALIRSAHPSSRSSTSAGN